MHQKVTIIILNWNGWEDTIECLESLYQINYPNYDVILVDNNSEDNSLEKIRDYCNGKLIVKSNFFKYDPKNKPINIFEYRNEESKCKNEIINIPLNRKLILIKNNKNYGFAEGNNIAINFALNSLNPDYILLLNNDTIVEKNFLNESVSVAESNEKFGIIGSRVYFYEFNGKTDIVQSIGGKIDWIKFPGYCCHTNIIGKNLNNSVETDWVTGAVMLIKIKEINIKLLNNEFFFGCEDIDLCINLKKQNYKIVVALNSIVWHKAGVSRRKKYHNQFKKYGIYIKTNLKFIKKHNNKFYLYLPIYFCQIMLFIFMDNIKRISNYIK